MRVVVDTNVWVSGLIVPDSPPGRVLEAVRRGAVQAVASWELAEEIVEVLRRPKLRRYGIENRDVNELLVLLAPLLPSVEVDAPVRDPDDAPVIAAAIAGGAALICTGDDDLRGDPEIVSWLERRHIETLSPLALLERLP